MVVRTDRVRKLAVILVSDFDKTTKLKHAGPGMFMQFLRFNFKPSHVFSSVLLFTSSVEENPATPMARLKIHKIKTATFSIPLYQSKKGHLSELQGYFHHSSLILKLLASFVCISTNFMASYISELVPYNK